MDKENLVCCSSCHGFSEYKDWIPVEREYGTIKIKEKKCPLCKQLVGYTAVRDETWFFKHYDSKGYVHADKPVHKILTTNIIM